MSITKIEELRARRAAAYTAMNEIDSRADAEGNLSAEDTAEFTSRESEFDTLTANIARMEKTEGLAPTLNIGQTNGAEGRSLADGSFEVAAPSVDSDEYREAFDQYCRHGSEELSVEQRTALSVGSSPAGGYTVAQEWVRQLIESSREYGVIERLATHFQTGDSGQVHVPTVTTRATAALTTEANAFTESEDVFSEVVFDSYKLGVIMKISDELLHDSIFDLAAFMAKSAGQAIGVKANNYFVVGTGTSQPNGITAAASVGKTAAGVAAVTTDELIDLYHSVLSPYRNRSVFIMKDATLAAVRKLKDTTNQYLWQPGLQAGVPDSLLGKPVYTDPDMPTMATGVKSIVFGDISAYWIREVGSATVKRLEELYAASGQVGFRVDRRLDGDLVDTAAVKTLAQA